MFVEALKRQNPALISAALSLWQQGKIAPDSWVIDVDQVLENGKRLIETARLYGIELYLMTKQFGRNPWLAEKLLALGYSGIVAVDYKRGASHAPRRFAGSASGASGTNPLSSGF